jgi:sugar phosphate isomerase/epimerase
MKMNTTSRRDFLRWSLGAGAALAGAASLPGPRAAAAEPPAAAMRFGLVTYQWGNDWDLPTLIANCRRTGLKGVELRTQHAHHVEPNLSRGERQEVKKRFADSPITLVGLGTNQDFHHPDPAKLRKSIELAKAFVKLGHDVGGSGVKVKPNDLPKGVPEDKTTEQIGNALNELGAFAADYGQQIRLEIHGGCSRIPVIRKIIAVATHPNVRLCWNSNQTDLEPPGLEANFNSLKNRFGATTHVRPLDTPKYPWADLIKLFVRMDYRGWILLEAGTKVDDRIKAIIAQRKLFEGMVAAAGERP